MTDAAHHILTDTPIAGVARITLNRPDALNSFTFEMYESLLATLEAIRFDPAIRVVILTGAGSGFCAGHDVRAGGSPAWVARGLGTQQRGRAIMAKLGHIPVLMRALPQPVITAVNGVAAGGGYALALAADLCIAASSAKFVNAFHNAGTGHELGLSYTLPRAIGTQRAAELLFTGRAVMAEEAARIGMILRVSEDGTLMQDVLALAESIMANSPIGIALTKQSLWLNASAGSLEAAIEMENRGIAISQATEDSAEKRKAFGERRQPTFNQK